MRVGRLLDDLAAELTILWGVGLALPGPDRAPALRDLADGMDGAGLGWAAARLRALADALGVDAERGEAYRALQSLGAWQRTFRAAWGAEEARRRLEATSTPGAPPTRPAGFTGTVAPVGILLAGGALEIHGVDGDGNSVVLVDEIGGLDTVDPIHEPVTSRLFQDRLTLAAILSSTLSFTDHPFTEGREGRRLRPAFHSRPVLGPAPHPPVRRDLSATGKGPRRVVVAVDPQGRWSVGGEEVSVGEVLSFNLAKRRAVSTDPLDAVVVSRGGGLQVLEALDVLGDRAFPAVDPGAFRWAAAELPEGGGSLLGAVGLGPAVAVPDSAPLARAVLGWIGGGPVALRPVPPETAPVEDALGCAWSHLVAGHPIPDALAARFVDAPDPSPALEGIAVRALCLGGTPGRALLEAAASRLRRGLRNAPDLWPTGRAVWSLADALTRLSGGDPTVAPVAALRLPAGGMRAAVVGPLSRWIAGRGDLDEAEDAWLLVVASGEAGRYLVDLEG